jgi:hypothetical protein
VNSPTKEKVFNLFLFVERDLITELGVTVHEVEGTDPEKLSFLQARVDQDSRTSKRLKLRIPLEWREYQSMQRLGTNTVIFEELYCAFGAPINPLSVITPILDNVLTFQAITGMGRLDLAQFQGTPLSGPGVMLDYLQAYVSDGQFDMPRLINDDYFLAIKLLFNNRYYVSAAKLLVSFLDTVGFIEAGDASDAFKLWLTKYAALNSLGVSEDELWEFRNGLLHMTNLDSRKVRAGKVSRLILHVGDLPAAPAPGPGYKNLNLTLLIDTIKTALERWLESYNREPQKLVDFVSRYDQVLSDTRVAIVEIQ